MLDSLIKRIRHRLGHHQDDPGHVTVYAFKARANGIQPQAGTPPEIEPAAKGILDPNRATRAIKSEGPMLVPNQNVRTTDAAAVRDAPEFGVQPNSIATPERSAERARPGSVGMYDYDHPAHPVNRTHQPDRLAQLQRGAHARAMARDTRTRRSR
jgi:hypothetical protein